MKHLLSIAMILCAMALWLGCNNKSMKDGASEDALADSLDPCENCDSIKFETNLIKYDKSANNASVELKVDFPISDNQDLVNEIGNFINDNLDIEYAYGLERTKPSPYQGDVTDGDKLVSFWGDYLLKDLQEGYDGGFERDSIDVVYNGDKYVTYRALMFVEYRDQEHGRGCTRGATFRKCDGKRISLIADTANVKYKELLRQTAKQYFIDDNYQIDDSLAEMYVNNWTEEILPWNLPYMDDKNVYYGTPYDMGLHVLAVPLDKMMPFLSKDAKKLLKTTKKNK